MNTQLVKAFSWMIVVVFFSCSDGSEKAEVGTENISWDIRDDYNLEFDTIKLCTELIPDENYMNDNAKIDTSYFYDSLGRVDKISQYIGDFPAKVDAAELTPYRWHKKELDVTFLDGDSAVVKRVINSARKWQQYCGIVFNFGLFENPDISISFKHKGSWSYIGSYSKQVSPSMNFGWLSSSTDEYELNRVVLHEFGHSLGLIHEHQSPNVRIPWDTTKVYAYYKKPPNKWDKSKVDNNIFHKYSQELVNATDFDSLSIMLYSIPQALTKNGYHTRINFSLSPFDTLLVSQIYPKL